MLNTNKNLQQRMQIMMTAFILIIGIGGAITMNAPKLQGLVTYAVLATNVNSFSVTTDLSGDCEFNTLKICLVKSAAPETGGQIPFTGAVIESRGLFIPAP